MELERIKIKNHNLRVYSLNTVVVGSGASAFNAADRLYNYGQEDIAIVTEGINKGTSRNTGSDKQTYYKLTLSGKGDDSVHSMAKTLFDGGAMDGDIALVEASLSAQCFYKLVDIGVEFPHNKYGEFVGYKTDHDPRQRATSIGPLTSKSMTEKLQKQIEAKNIKIFDGFQVIKILNDKSKTKVMGLIALDLNNLTSEDDRYVIFNCTNIVYATGGPAGIYKTSVYPESQSGASGIAFEAGANGKNLTEWQYGMSSIKFRWNVSGTYQQVLPRYVSTDQDGNDEREFLNEYFEDYSKLLDAVFLKGYQWPFDPRKAHNYGSSLIDILVYNETVNKNRRVFLDYTKNPLGDKFDLELLGEESYEYLKRSNALFGKPIDRLAHMNQPAIDLYKNNGIDITQEKLEIAICAQHNNGGLYGDIWWESNLKHFFPVGEVNGSHGIYRPGGSALNSGQVGSTRAAQYISKRYREEPIDAKKLIEESMEKIEEIIDIGKTFIGNINNDSNVNQIRENLGMRMSEYGSIVRSSNGVKEGLEKTKEALEKLVEDTSISSVYELPMAFQNRDLIITQFVYLSAFLDYIDSGGNSRGSYIVQNSQGIKPLEILSDKFKFSIDEGRLNDKIQITSFKDNECTFFWNKVKPILNTESWFENVWRDYIQDNIVK